jgi:hypothetical protein
MARCVDSLRRAVTTALTMNIAGPEKAKAETSSSAVSEPILSLDCDSRHGYTSQRGKARWAKPARRLAEENGSPTLSGRYCPKTWQAQSSLGAAMAGRLYKEGPDDWPTTRYRETRYGAGINAPTSEEISQRKTPPSESGTMGTIFHNDVTRFCGRLPCSQPLPDAESFNAGSLSPNPQHAFAACIWKISPLRSRHPGRATLRVAKDGGRIRLGERESLSQSPIQNLRSGEEMGLFLRTESCRRWSNFPRK